MSQKYMTSTQNYMTNTTLHFSIIYPLSTFINIFPFFVVFPSFLQFLLIYRHFPLFCLFWLYPLYLNIYSIVQSIYFYRYAIRFCDFCNNVYLYIFLHILYTSILLAIIYIFDKSKSTHFS